MAGEPMFGLAPHCAYYVVLDSQTHEAIAVLEAGGEAEARQFFVALRHMLQASSKVDLRVLKSLAPPNELPVFRRQYFEALQANAAEERCMSGVTRH
jgi:hypothetical protein